MWMTARAPYWKGGRSGKLAAAMTNVVPLRPGAWPDGLGVTTTAARDATALVGRLACLVDQIESAGAQVALLDRPALQIERAIQMLFDAATALEQATDVLIEGDEREG